MTSYHYNYIHECCLLTLCDDNFIGTMCDLCQPIKIGKMIVCKGVIVTLACIPVGLLCS